MEAWWGLYRAHATYAGNSGAQGGYSFQGLNVALCHKLWKTHLSKSILCLNIELIKSNIFSRKTTDKRVRQTPIPPSTANTPNQNKVYRNYCGLLQ